MSKNIFEALWNFSPQVVSMIIIIAILIYITFKFSMFFAEFKDMGVRLTNVEKKVDSIIEFLINKFGK
jgi:hypothetical protein